MILPHTVLPPPSHILLAFSYQPLSHRSADSKRAKATMKWLGSRESSASILQQGDTQHKRNMPLEVCPGTLAHLAIPEAHQCWQMAVRHGCARIAPRSCMHVAGPLWLAQPKKSAALAGTTAHPHSHRHRSIPIQLITAPSCMGLRGHCATAPRR